MSGIGSTLRRHWIEIAWALFATANVAVILILNRWETIPFHFVWVSLTLVYGFRVWGLRSTVLVLLLVTAATGAALVWTVTRGHERLDELAEVPLMAAMFVAMVWHAGRRQAAMDEARRSAETEHRLLERQQEFVRDASHELRTPITVARGHAELIRASNPSPQVVEDAAVVLDELSRLSRLSERLLILAAAEHPDFLVIAQVPVEPLVVRMVRRWSPTARRAWQVEVSAEGWVPADEERMEIALDALIENAVKFTRDGDRISISAYAAEGSMVVEVGDEGAGIPSEYLPGVFDRFSRADRDRARGNGGTGLGLAMAKAIVEAHGGSIFVASAEGRGATFRVSLPGFHDLTGSTTGGSVVARPISAAPVPRS